MATNGFQQKRQNPLVGLCVTVSQGCLGWVRAVLTAEDLAGNALAVLPRLEIIVFSLKIKF